MHDWAVSGLELVQTEFVNVQSERCRPGASNGRNASFERSLSKLLLEHFADPENSFTRPEILP